MSLVTLPEVPVLEEEMLLSGNAVTALRCWEARPGEIFTVKGPDHRCYRGRLTALDDDSASIIPFHAFPGPPESKVRIHVYQALPEKERFELILQKLTELGVARIIPFVSKRSIDLAERDSGQKKSHRWPHILLRAARQCRRAMIPELSPVMGWQELLSEIPQSDLTLILYEKEAQGGPRQLLGGITSGTVSLVVGPEGGLTRPEVEEITAGGGHSISLGNRILRTETAAITATGIIQYETGGMD